MRPSLTDKRCNRKNNKLTREDLIIARGQAPFRSPERDSPGSGMSSSARSKVVISGRCGLCLPPHFFLAPVQAIQFRGPQHLERHCMSGVDEAVETRPRSRHVPFRNVTRHTSPDDICGSVRHSWEHHRVTQRGQISNNGFEI